MMNYQKYRLQLNNTTLKKLLVTLSFTGTFVIVGLRLEDHNINQKQFQNVVQEIGLSSFYENFPMWIMSVENIDLFADKWDLIKSSFQETVVFFLKNQPTLTPDALYENFFNTYKSDNLLNLTYKIWQKQVDKKLQRWLFQAPLLILSNSMDDWSLICAFQEEIDDKYWKHIIELLENEIM